MVDPLSPDFQSKGEASEIDSEPGPKLGVEPGVKLGSGFLDR
jgi:hypothetical protein